MRKHWLGVCAALLLGLPAARGGEAEGKTLKVGHVGHDHQIALFIAAARGEKLKEASGGIWFREKKKYEVYDLMDGDQELCQVTLTKVGGGSAMPAAVARNEIEVGLGGVAPTAAAIDKGAKMKIVAPLNCDGDMLLLRPEFAAKGWDGFVELANKSEAPLRIGYKAPSATAYLIFLRALNEAGLACGPQATDADGKPVKVLLVNLQKDANMLPSLQSKAVDGMVMNQPVVALAVDKRLGNVVCDLRDAPPAGKWLNHPCCCVAASEQALAEKRELVTALVRAVVAGGRYIAAEPTDAVAIAADWTKTPQSVEEKSVSTVVYPTTFDEKWRQGMNKWFEMMNELNQFTQELKDKTPAELNALVSDETVLAKALEAMPKP